MLTSRAVIKVVGVVYSSIKPMKNLHNIGKISKPPPNIFFHKKVQLHYLLGNLLDNSAENIVVRLRK